MSKGSKLAIGAVIGAVSGIVAGILTAPKSGKETREDIKRKAEELKDQALSTADDVRSSAEVKAR
ncbi:YtxH domain-containing protein, partial [Candidatus Saccharibacteria bacterium]|nr:YtxH domain-containing protein [Candidatus Saccharibacteria bacterium]